MTEGWSALEPLEWLDPEQPLPVAKIEAACARIEGLSVALRDELLESLRSAGKKGLADVLKNGFKPPDDRGTLRPHDRKFLNSYFATTGRLWHLPKAAKAEDLACQAAFRVQLAFDLQDVLLQHLRRTPTARVINAEHSLNRASYERIFRFVELQRIVGLIKGEYYCIEYNSVVARDFLSKKGATVAASVSWPYDSDFMYEKVLFGFTRAPFGAINSLEYGSAITAAGVVRSYMESVLYNIDLESSCSEIEPLYEAHPEIGTMDGKGWKNAIAIHLKDGRLKAPLDCWADATYSMLCRSLHNGEKLTVGEVWALGHVVQHLQSVLACSRGEQV